MSDNVIPIGGKTLLDTDPDEVLRVAEGLETVIVVGMTHDGKEHFAASTSDVAYVNWLLDRMKLQLLTIEE